MDGPVCQGCRERDALIATLQARIAELEQRLAALEARLGTNSSNSSLPPSANPLGAPTGKSVSVHVCACVAGLAELRCRHGASTSTRCGWPRLSRAQSREQSGRCLLCGRGLPDVLSCLGPNQERLLASIWATTFTWFWNRSPARTSVASCSR